MTQIVVGNCLHGSAPVRIAIEQNQIASIEPCDAAAGVDLPWIGAGLIDLQINGYGGIDFNTHPLSEESLHEATRRLWAQGVTSYFPTLITNSDEAIEAALDTIAKACRADQLTASSIRGIHLEGPFLSPEDGARGAHSAAYIKAPDLELFQRWQRIAEGRIAILTMSPEWEGAARFIKECADSGVVVSIGHTSATPEQIRNAAAAGASMSTHLGNGSHLMLPRHSNYIWEQLASDELAAGIIADGFHLPEAMLKVFLRAKRDQIFLVSDAVYLSGMKPGRYNSHIGGDIVLTAEGRLHLVSNEKILAGSAQMLTAGINHLVRTGLLTLEESWALASQNPARIMKLKRHGVIETGAVADLVLFHSKNDDIAIEAVYKQGQKVIG